MGISTPPLKGGTSDTEVGIWSHSGQENQNKDMVKSSDMMNIVINETSNEGSGKDNIDKIFHCWNVVEKH